MTFGWRRPVVLLPDDVPDWPAERRAAALLHEAAHIARRDWLTLAFAHLVCALYWFHPLVWLVAARLRAEAERAADDRVLLTGLPAADYARHLLEIARALASRHPVSSAALAMADAPPMERRLRAILDSAASRRPSRHSTLVLLTVLVVAAVLIAAARPQTTAQTPPTPAQKSVPLTAVEKREQAEKLRQIEVEYAAVEAQLADIERQRATLALQRERLRLRMTTDRVQMNGAATVNARTSAAAFLDAQIQTYLLRMHLAQLKAPPSAGGDIASINRQIIDMMTGRLSLLKQERDYLTIAIGDAHQKALFLQRRIEFLHASTRGKGNPEEFPVRQHLAETLVVEKTQNERMRSLNAEILKQELALRSLIVESSQTPVTSAPTKNIRYRVFDITYPPNGTLPAQGSPHRIRIEATDGAGTRTIYDKIKMARERVQVRATLNGERASLRIFDNGELRAEVKK